MLNNTKKTRFKITVFVVAYFAIMGAVSLVMKETQVTIICLGGITASGVMYKHAETKRKSGE
jgi:hypothetical protein